MNRPALLTRGANTRQIYEALINSTIRNPWAHHLVANIMDDYPSKRRKTSPFTAVLVTPSDTPKEPASHDEHDRSLAGIFSTQDSQIGFNPNEVHPPNPLADSSNKQQYRPTPITGKKAFQDSTNGVFCVNDTLSYHQLRCDTESERLAGCGILPGKFEVAASGRTEIVPENGTLGTLSPEANPHPLLNGKYQAAIAEEPRASPPASDTEKASSAPQLEQSTLEPGQLVLSAHVSNATSSGDRPVSEQEPSTEQEPELPFTPTKQPLDDFEPRLPSTPTQLGLEAPPTPPKGLAAATSPRKLRRKRQVVHKSSPLKLGDSKSTDKVDETPYVSNLEPRVPVVNIRRSAQMCTFGAEHVKFQIDKSGTGLSKLLRSVTDAEIHTRKIIQQTPSLGERLALFLPFSRPVTSMQNLATPHLSPAPEILVDVEASQPPEVTQSESLNYPLPPLSSMTAIESPNFFHSPPSSMTVAESFHPSRPPEASSRLLEIKFAAHQQLPVVSIQLMVDKATENTINMKISSIPSWADSELGLWLRNEAQSLRRATIERAVTSYWKTSLIRASCWQRCEEEIGAACTQPVTNPSSNELESGLFQKKPLGKESIFPRTSHHPPPPSAPGNTAPAPAAAPTSNPINSLQPHLGRQHLLFTHAPVSLLISWHITITAHGTTQSSISARPAYPERWTDYPEAGQALGRVTEAFDALLARKGVFESIKELCARIFSMRRGLS